jgi:hypothetical protein
VGLTKAAFVALITMTSETLAFRQDLKFIYSDFELGLWGAEDSIQTAIAHPPITTNRAA